MMPAQTARVNFGCAISKSTPCEWSGIGKSNAQVRAAIAIKAAKIRNRAAPPNAPTILGAEARKIIAKMPSARLTIAKSLCGLVARPTVPCVTESADPAATPAAAWQTAMIANAVWNEASPNATAESANPIAASSRPLSRLKRGAKKKKARRYGAGQKKGHQRAGLLRIEPICRDQRANPDRQRDQINHAGAMSHHERGPPR